MQNIISKKIQEHMKKRTWNRRRKRVLTALGCIVVFCTVYALMLPAVTMTGETFCGLEHTHTLSCYSDPEADVEEESSWTQSDLTGVWAEDVISVAERQIGYTESTRNYTVTEDGKMKGFTRYGEWYGAPYGDWDAMFVSFCLYHADIPEDSIPYEKSSFEWSEKLKERNMYADAAGYSPQTGDIIFFDCDNDEAADHVGLVEKIKTGSSDNPLYVTIIEGDYSDKGAGGTDTETSAGGAAADAVMQNTYDISNAYIMGYGILPKNTEDEVMAINTNDSGIALKTSDFSTLLTSALADADEIDGERFLAVWDEDKVSQITAYLSSPNKSKEYTLEYSEDEGTSWTAAATAKSDKDGGSLTLTADAAFDPASDYKKVKFRVCTENGKTTVLSATLPEVLDGVKAGFSDWLKNFYVSDYGGTTPETVEELYTSFAKYMELATVTISAEKNDDGGYTGTVAVTPAGTYTYQWQYMDDNKEWREFCTTDTATINLSEIDDLQSGPHKIRCDIYQAGEGESVLLGTSNILKFNPREEEYAEAIEKINNELNLGTLAINGTQFKDYFFYGNVAKDSRVPFSDAESYADYLAGLYLDEGIDAVRTAWHKYLYDIYDPSHDNGNKSNENQGYPSENGATYGDQNLGWPKDGATSFHTTGTPEVDALNYNYLEQGVDYGNFVTGLNKKATAKLAGDENTEREYLVDIEADAQAKAVGPVAIILQIQTSWQMFDLNHANALAGSGSTEVGAVANNTELATLYDIKQALLRFVDYMETKYPGNNLVLGITETQHAKSQSMFKGSDKKGNGLYVSNNYEILRNSILEWDSFGNCEHVHYDSEQLQNAVKNLSNNLADLKYNDGDSIPYEDIRKVAVIVGGPTENTKGENGYACTLPWGTFASSGIDSVYGIRTNNGTSYAANGELSWLDYSGNTSGTPYSEGVGTAFTEKYIATTEDLVYEYLVRIAEQEMGINGIDIDAPNAYVEDVTVTDTIQKEFILNEDEPITATVTNKDGSEVKTYTLTKDDLDFTKNADGTTTITYNFGRAWNGQKCNLHFGIVAKEDYIGSNNVYTNVKTPTLTYEHKVLDEDGNETGKIKEYDVNCFDTPQVNVPIRYSTIDGGSKTVLVDTAVDLKELGNEIPKQAEALLDNYPQINGTLSYVWELPDGSSKTVGSVTVKNGVPGSLPDISEIFTPNESGDYEGNLKLTFTPEGVSDANKNFSDSTTKTAVNALTKSGKVRINAVEKGEKTSLIVRKVWDTEPSQDNPQVEFKLLANGDDTGKTYVLNEENNWEMQIEDLEAVTVDSSGNAQVIKYTAEEINIPDGYVADYSEETKTTDNFAAKTRFTIICTEKKDKIRTVCITCKTSDGQTFTKNFSVSAGFAQNEQYTFEMDGMPLDADGNPLEITSWEFSTLKSDGSTENIKSDKITKSYTQSKYQSGVTSVPVYVITNTANNYILPETGSSGIYPYTLSGALMAVSALMYRYILRRKRERRLKR